jgi:hypothetical protein
VSDDNGDVFLLLATFVFAALSFLALGWTLNGIGPALLATSGRVWQLRMQWLRHRSWLHHKDSGFAPGTQHLVLAAQSSQR